MLALIASWLVVAMNAWVQPLPHDESAQERYRSMADDITEVVYDVNEKPLYEGPNGRAKTALFMASIAGFESSYTADVDSGKKRGTVGDACIMQLVISGHNRLHLVGDVYEWSRTEGWTYEDILADRKKCIRGALHIARESFRICHSLSLYTVGKCDPKEPKARHREERARVRYTRFPSPVADQEVLALLLAE
jgi:hypothetical protein